MVSKGRLAVSGPQESDGVLERVLAGYRGYLLFERAVCETTADCYEPRARLFLSQREGLAGLGLDGLTAADVSDFSCASARCGAPVRRRCWRWLSARCCGTCM